MKTIYFLMLLKFICFAQTDTSLVELIKIDSTFILDVRYATSNNFTGQKVYNDTIVFLRKEAAEKLSRANQYLIKNYSYSIKVYDGFRPLSVQKIFWKIMPDKRYVANPTKGSRHNRGAAVDLTLVDSNGVELDMGTDFDNFTVRAHHTYKNLPKNVLRNRKLLKEVMEKFGFSSIETEWWHYDLKGWTKYSIIENIK